MDYSVRTGPLADLVSSLRDAQADRGGVGESERAIDAGYAAHILESGGAAAYFDRVIYGVGNKDRRTVFSGGREKVSDELRDAVEGWEHQGRSDLAAQAREALERVAQGAESVRVGHLVYEIRE